MHVRVCTCLCMCRLPLQRRIVFTNSSATLRGGRGREKGEGVHVALLCHILVKVYCNIQCTLLLFCLGKFHWIFLS